MSEALSSYQLEREYYNQVICGDFREHREKMAALCASDFSTAILISDPPYNQKYHYEGYNDNLPDEEYQNLLLDVFGGIFRSVVIHYPEQTITLLGGGKMRFPLQEVVCWVYPSNTRKQSRLITWWACKPRFDAIPQRYRNQKDKRIQQRMRAGMQARSYDWWQINQVKNVSKKDVAHPCPIPFELAEKIILSTTYPGDIVIDPFCGSGTILAAAKRHGRRYVGFDISPAYCELARKRLAETEVKLEAPR